MSINEKLETYLQEILSKIREGKVVLFLGAGASRAAGGPLAKTLTEMIKKEFSKIDQSLNEFIDVCQDVIDTPPYHRNQLEEFIKSQLDSLRPTRAHQIMTKYDWAAIFTTNFDDLIELAYRLTPERIKNPQPIYSEKFQVNPADRSKIYIFKIMGSITALESETGTMVLSRSDYTRALRRRKEYIRILSDFVKNGTILFIGYSFRDRFILDIIDEIIEEYGKDRLPWSYALFDQLELDEKTNYKFTSRKIIPLKCSFEEFFEYLDKNYKISPKTLKSVSFKLRGYNLEVDEDEARNYAEFFEILNEEKLGEPPGQKDDFFMGINKSWGAFKEGWDFKRDLYNSIKQRTLEELKKYDIGENKILLITGMPGIGKTMLLRRLAYDVYSAGEAPVIFLQPTKTTFDYKLLATFIENLNNQLVKKDYKTAPLKPLILVDDAASMIRHLVQLKDYLASRARPALIVAAERKNEWDLIWSTFSFRIDKKNIFELPEKLSESEKSRIIEHLYNLKYIKAKGEFWDKIIDQEFEESFFATIYTLVHPSRKPLNEIIQDQYKRLTGITQKAFRNICFFHRFNLPINQELLVRSLRRSYSDFMEEILNKDIDKIIYEEWDEQGNLLYRTHHRIIAEKTIKFFFGDPAVQKEIYIEILKESVLSNQREREICEKLLIQHIGPNARPQIFTYDQQRQIFKIVCEKNPLRRLIHHWGVLELDDVNYREAEKLLKKALELPREEMESYRGESDRAILTSLGNLYSHIGMEALKKENQKEAEEYFKDAEIYFNQAKYGGFSEPHPYHAHALMWYLKGKTFRETVESLNCYAKSLEILSVARDNLNEDDLLPIYQLETQIWAEIGDKTRIEQNLIILRDRYNTASGYYLYAELLWRKAHEKHNKERQKICKLALRKVEKGLKYFPHDERCLRLKAKLLKELEPSNLKKYYQALLQWKSVCFMPNASLLYELGRIAFLLGYYDYSKEFFEELERGVGMGHRLRSRSRHPIRDEKGNKKEFEGTIINILSPYIGDIRCETLRSLRYPIPFRPVACKFTPSVGNLVKFHIEFTFRGPVAVNVRKL